MLSMLSSSKSTEDEGARRQGRPQKAIILESNEINLVRLPSNANINDPPSSPPVLRTKQHYLSSPKSSPPPLQLEPPSRHYPEGSLHRGQSVRVDDQRPCLTL
jgi:hypothetical protein